MMKTIESFVKKVVTAQPADSLASVAKAMERHNVGAVVIVESHKPVGIVTDRDLALEVVAHGVLPQAAVRTVMSRPVKTAYRDEGVFDATQTMMAGGVRRLPVIDDDDELVGVVTMDDLLHVLSRELSSLIQGIDSEMKSNQTVGAP
jgi:CBS domain-containing protein